MNRQLAGRQDRLDTIGTHDSRPRVIRVNNGKVISQADVIKKDGKVDPAKSMPFRNVAANNASFFGTQGLNLQLKEKKDLATLSFFASKTVKVESKAENDQKPIKKFNLSPHWENKIISGAENGKSEYIKPKAHRPRGSLIEHEFEVINSELERMKLFRLKPIEKCNKQIFSIGSHGVLKVCQSLRLRPETIYQAMFLFHFACSQLSEKEIIQFIIPSITIAAKTEEYYPPSIDELIKKISVATAISTLPGFHLITKKTVIEMEAILLFKRHFVMKTPPIMDLANIIHNMLGKFDSKHGTALSPYIYKLLQIEDLFTDSLITIAVAAIRMHEQLNIDPENLYRATDARVEPSATDLSSDLLLREFDYMLNSAAVAALVVKSSVQETADQSFSFFNGPSKVNKPTSFFMNR